MKLIFDLLTVVLFFIIYKVYGMYPAIATAMILYSVQTLGQWLVTKKVDKIQWFTLFLILTLGAATFFFHNELFFKWKPTAVYGLFAIIFLGSQLVGEKTAIEHLLGQSIQLPHRLWTYLNVSWIIFFIALGLLNLFIVYHFDTDTWVNFKLFGILGLTFAFIVLQAVYLAKYGETVASIDKPSHESHE